MYGADISIEHRRELTEKVLKTAMAEFQDKGIKAVKMDDIAGALSMSKRTLYELFGTKEQLLLECVRQWQKDKEAHMDRFIKERKPNVIAIIVEFYRYQMKCLSYVSSSYFYDLHKYPAVIISGLRQTMVISRKVPCASSRKVWKKATFVVMSILGSFRPSTQSL